MCGINGILSLDPGGPPVDRDELVRMRDAMAPRGPDGCGLWVAPGGRIGFGHRRLAIIDLSEGGAQPMRRCDGRYTIVFNGEIYNYRELRVALERQGASFRSESDTEVILALYERERERMLSRLRGMFALAIWDEREARLLLARDPLGIKPLYYAVGRDHLRFASQVRALEQSPAVAAAPDPAGVVGFLLWGWVPEPFTTRREIRGLPAGHMMVIDHGRVTPPARFEPCVTEGAAAGRGLEDALDDSVRAHLVADVPVAVFLSAGLDSSLITALAVRHLARPPMTFTVRFKSLIGTPLDEGPLAAEVARSLGTPHVERVIDRPDFPDLFERAVEAMDQPSVDGFNVFVVSKVARDAGLKVVLSGLGGDELFGSYPSFRDVPRWNAWSRRAAAVPGLARLWPRMARAARPGQPKLAGLLSHGGSLGGAYFLRRGLFLPDELPRLVGPEFAAEGLAAYEPVAAAEAFAAGRDGREREARGADPWRSVQAMETGLYMRNQLLRDADWASMAWSLELRVPLVDSCLADAVAGMGFEPARTHGKAAALRRMLPALPEGVWQRPKSGFILPVTDWLADSKVAAGAHSSGRGARGVAARVVRRFVDLGEPWPVS